MTSNTNGHALGMTQDGDADPPKRSAADEPDTKKIIELSDDEAELKEAFNDEKDKVRFLLILSPT